MDFFSQTHIDFTTPGFIRPCVDEFGPHDNHEDCDRMLADMSSGYDMDDYLVWEQDMYSREAEESMLGRPLFPNEY